MSDDPVAADSPVDPLEIGEDDAPPYKEIFEANACIGAGECAAVSDNWELSIETGIASPRSFFLTEADLEANVRAAEACPAKKGAGVIHVVDRRSGEEVAPDADGDGSLSVDW